jgi:hypothetical protein
VHFILIKPVFSGHLSYETVKTCFGIILKIDTILEEGQDQEKGNQKTEEVMHHKRNMTMFRSRRRNLTQDTTNTRIKRMEVEVGEVFRGI